jgi:DNA end-binding protein Ku
VTVRDQERAMAEAYIATLEAEFDPTRYHSEYREALEELVEAKASGLEPALPQEEAPDSGEVVDLVAALRASVEAAKARRGEAAEQAPAAPKRSTAKKSAPKKTASKKAPAKKAPAKASATKKSSAKKAPAKKSTAQKSSRTRKSA